jgi:hypothetical protein
MTFVTNNPYFCHYRNFTDSGIMKYIGTVFIKNGRFKINYYFPGPQINNPIPYEPEWLPTHSGPHYSREPQVWWRETRSKLATCHPPP